MIVGRMRGEPKVAWAAFQIYLALGIEARSIENVLRHLRPLPLRPERVARWAERFDWAERAIAHARQVEESERIERITRLERQADELRIKMLEPYERATARYDALVERGVPGDSPEMIGVMVEMMAALPLAEEALMLTGRAEWIEAVLDARASRVATVRSIMMAEVAGDAAHAEAGVN